jgi:DNA-directed RNA polymerase specialized sigma24 family protein
MAQETFVVVIRGSARYQPRAKFRTYLYAIALKLLWTRAVRSHAPTCGYRCDPSHVATRTFVPLGSGETVLRMMFAPSGLKDMEYAFSAMYSGRPVTM